MFGDPISGWPQKGTTDYWVGKVSSKIASWSQPNSGTRSANSVSNPASSQCLYPTPGPIALNRSSPFW